MVESWEALGKDNQSRQDLVGVRRVALRMTYPEAIAFIDRVVTDKISHLASRKAIKINVIVEGNETSDRLNSFFDAVRERKRRNRSKNWWLDHFVSGLGVYHFITGAKLSDKNSRYKVYRGASVKSRDIRYRKGWEQLNEERDGIIIFNNMKEKEWTALWNYKDYDYMKGFESWKISWPRSERDNKMKISGVMGTMKRQFSAGRRHQGTHLEEKACTSSKHWATCRSGSENWDRASRSNWW